MKKIILASAVLFSSLSLVACDTNQTSDTAGDDEKVIAKDSVPSEYEVTKTTVETDTTTDTKTVDVDKDDE